MGAAPSLVCPLPFPSPRLFFQPSLYLSQIQPTCPLDLFSMLPGGVQHPIPRHL